MPSGVEPAQQQAALTGERAVEIYKKMLAQSKKHGAVRPRKWPDVSIQTLRLLWEQSPEGEFYELVKSLPSMHSAREEFRMRATRTTGNADIWRYVNPPPGEEFRRR